MNFPLGGILLLYYTLLNLPCIASQKNKNKEVRMFETTKEIFLIFLFFFRFLGQSNASVFQRAQFK